jgi:hypothetical protein
MLLAAIVVICFIIAPTGIVITAHSIIAAPYEKGDWSNTEIAFMGIVFAISAVLIAIGIKKYIVIKDLKTKLSQMKLLEETIFNEVLIPNLHQLK